MVRASVVAKSKVVITINHEHIKYAIQNEVNVINTAKTRGLASCFRTNQDNENHNINPKSKPNARLTIGEWYSPAHTVITRRYRPIKGTVGCPLPITATRNHVNDDRIKYGIISEVEGGPGGVSAPVLFSISHSTSIYLCMRNTFTDYCVTDCRNKSFGDKWNYQSRVVYRTLAMSTSLVVHTMNLSHTVTPSLPKKSTRYYHA